MAAEKVFHLILMLPFQLNNFLSDAFTSILLSAHLPAIQSFRRSSALTSAWTETLLRERLNRGDFSTTK